MKTLKFSLLLAFLSSPIILFSNFRPQKAPPVLATIQGDAEQNRLRVVVKKPLKVPVTFRVLDPAGQSLHEESVSSSSSTVLANFNLGALPNGTYRVEVIDQNRVQARLVHLSPAIDPTAKRQINILPIQ